eukprot:366074-Chlamydomonas_euryale.AAC.15
MRARVDHRLSSKARVDHRLASKAQVDHRLTHRSASEEDQAGAPGATDGSWGGESKLHALVLGLTCAIMELTRTGGREKWPAHAPDITNLCNHGREDRRGRGGGKGGTVAYTCS